MPLSKFPPPTRDTSDLRRIERIDESRRRALVRLVTSIGRAVIMYGTRTVRHLGLSVSQAIVTGQLFQSNGCRQKDLRRTVALDKGNVTRALQKLEELGLVKREPDSVDRRVVRVYLTKKALEVESEMFAETSRWEDRLAASLAPQEREALITLLLRVEHNVQGMLDEEEEQGRHLPPKSPRMTHGCRTPARVRRTEASRAEFSRQDGTV